MVINNKCKKERMSKLQKTILEVLKNGKYEFLNKPLNAKVLNGTPYHEANDGNYHELMTQVSQTLNKTDDEQIIGDAYHKPTDKFRVSFSRAVKSLSKKGLVDLVFYHNLMDRRWIQKKCAVSTSQDNEPCTGCEKVKNVKVLNFFVESGVCNFNVLSTDRARGICGQRSKVFSVFLKGESVDKYDDTVQAINEYNKNLM